MAKRNKAKFASKSRKSALRIEALEQRQLLAAVTGGGTEVGSNINHSNGNVYDQVLMTGTSVTVGADWQLNQITRVSFLDQNGDIIQAEFSGKGTMTVSLENFTAAAPATQYNQPDVSYVSGLATFTIQGSDATTNFNVFSVGTGNAFLGAANPIFAGGLDGGNNVADVAALRIVADPQNPGGFSTFGRIGAGNAVFAADTGTVGIAAQNVNVQGPVIIGDIDASNSGVPTLNFGTGSQFSTLQVAGGNLDQTNNVAITGGGFANINSTAGATSGGATLGAQVVAAADVAGIDTNPTTVGIQAPTVTALDSATAIDLTGKTQAQINDLFTGRTFTNALTVSGDLAINQAISAAAFTGGVTFSGEIDGTITVSGAVSSLSVGGNVDGAIAVTGALGNVSVTGNVTAQIGAASIGNVSVGGNLTALITTDTVTADNAFTTGEGAIGTVSVTGDIGTGGGVEGVLGIGNISVGDDITSSLAGGVFVTRSGTSGDAFLANIGTLTVEGDVNQGAGATLLHIDNNGTFGNVQIKGTGATAGTVEVGSILVDGVLGGSNVATGTISIANTHSSGDINWNGLTVAKVANSAGTVGGITITGGGSGADFGLDGAISAGTLTVGDIAVTGFSTIDIDATINAQGAGITLTTGFDNGATDDIRIDAAIGGSADVTTIGALNFSNTASDGEILINAQIGNAAATLGAVTLNVGTNDTTNVDFNADITGLTLPAVSVTADTVNMTGGFGLVAAGTTTTGTAGAITIAGALNLSAAAITVPGALESISVTGTTSVTGAAAISTGSITGSATFGTTTVAAAATLTTGNIGGSLTFGTTTNAGALTTGNIGGSLTLGTTTFTAAANASVTTGTIAGGLTLGATTFNNGDITTNSITGALTIGTAAGTNTFGAGSRVLVKGDVGSLVLNGVTDMSGNDGVSIDLDDSTSALDTIGSLTVAGRITGAAGIDIRASAIGDVSITSALTQDQVLVKNLDILAAPNGGTTSTAETVTQNGSNIQSYAIGNINIASSLALAYTGTRLFEGDSTFVALGKIGNVTVTGDVEGAQQTRLFTAAADGAWFGVGDTDGLLTQTFGLETNVVRYDDGNTTDTDTNPEDHSGVPDWTGGTVAIGNVTVNANQAVVGATVSGVEGISGASTDSADDTIEGFAVLSGVHVNATGADGDLITLGGAGTSTVNAVDIDANLTGTIGDVLISSNQAVGFLSEVTTATLVGTAGDEFSGIIAASSVGKVQSVTTVSGMNAAGEAAIIGDTNSAADVTVEDNSQIVVVIV